MLLLRHRQLLLPPAHLVVKSARKLPAGMLRSRAGYQDHGAVLITGQPHSDNAVDLLHGPVVSVARVIDSKNG